MPSLGHPYGNNEIIPKDTSILDTIDALRDKDLLVEGETGFDITPQGKSIRASVKFKPRESFLKKLSNVFTLKMNLSLKDILK